MLELRILEGLIAFFLILPLIKPFFSKLDPISGLVLLPFIGLGVSAAIFPVYGFRLECVPLLFFALFEAILYMPSAMRLLKDPWYDTSLFRRPVLSGISVLVLMAVMVIALFFAPEEGAGLTEKPGACPEVLRWIGTCGPLIRLD